MIEFLILYLVSKKVLTMYGISQKIKDDYSVLTLPSYGTIKPALNRMIRDGYVRTQKEMSSGGRPSTFYSITPAGEERLKELLLETPLENPIQFLTSARVKIACAEILSLEDQISLFKILKNKTNSIALDVKNLLENKNIEFYQKMVFDNLLCEYKNFSTLIEGLERASKN